MADGFGDMVVLGGITAAAIGNRRHNIILARPDLEYLLTSQHLGLAGLSEWSYVPYVHT